MTIETLSDIDTSNDDHHRAVIATCRNIGLDAILDDERTNAFNVAHQMMEHIVCDDFDELDAERYLIDLINSQLERKQD